MTWKPTDEMVKVAEDAAYAALEDVCGCCNAGCGMATLIAVQPLIAAEARAKALEEAAKIAENLDFHDEYDDVRIAAAIRNSC